MVDLKALSMELHAAAVEKGFWDVDDAPGKHIAKMLSELGEVVQADRAGVMYEIEHLNSKPEGVIAELADFAMMTLDLCAHIGDVLPDEPIENWNTNEEMAKEICELPAYQLVGALVAELVGMADVIDNTTFMNILYVIHEWVHGHGYDLWEIIRQKMEYNKLRPKLHGRDY